MQGINIIMTMGISTAMTIIIKYHHQSPVMGL